MTAAVGWSALDKGPNPQAVAAGYRTTGMWAQPTRQGVDVDQIVVHSAESNADIIGLDGGAEGVDRYMRTARRQVSWHATTDSDSIVWGCPWEWTCFHAGAGHNRRSVGFEQAYGAAQLGSLPTAWRKGLFRNASRFIAVAATYFGIPVKRVPGTDRGVVSHGTPSDAKMPGISPGSVRWDPGNEKDYDWDTVMEFAVELEGKGVAALGFDGELVGEAQKFLRSKGYDLLVDDDFGPITHGALRDWQAENGKPVTGVWEDRTAFTLPPFPANPAPPVFEPAPVPPITPPVDTSPPTMEPQPRGLATFVAVTTETLIAEINATLVSLNKVHTRLAEMNEAANHTLAGET